MPTPPSPRQRAKAALKAIIREAGNPGQLGPLVGVTRVAPYGWEVVPGHAIARAAKVFNRKPEDLRPDLTPFRLQQEMKKKKPGRGV